MAREVDPNTGMPTEVEGTTGAIGTGGERSENPGAGMGEPAAETAAEMEARIRAQLEAKLNGGAKPAAEEPKAETAAEMEARITAEIQARQVATATAGADKQEGPKRGRPTNAEKAAKAAAEAAEAAEAAQEAAGGAREPEADPDYHQTGTAVTAAQEGAGEVGEYIEGTLDALFEKNAGKGVNFEVRDITIPRLNLLQDMSPETKDRMPEFIPGARAGLWLNTVTRDLFPSVMIVPVSYKRRFVGWFPRGEGGKGGGLARMDVPEEEFLQYEETGIGIRSYKGEFEERQGQGRVKVTKTVDVVETPEWVVLLLGKAGTRPTPCAISFPRTKSKVSSQLNTIISMQEVTRRDGSTFTPPAFANVFMLSQAIDGEGAESYFIPKVELVGRVTRADIFERGRKLWEQCNAGEVTVAEAGLGE